MSGTPNLRVVTVLGARPQFVKAAPVSRALAEAGIEETYLHTGQHFDAHMSQVFFDELGLKRPEFHLGIHSLPHGAMTGRMLEGIEAVLSDVKPDWVIVYGDTDSTLAGALAAAKLHVPLAHVEAGLRSFNRRMAEEINRVLTDHAADLLLAPTRTAMANLAREGIEPSKVRLVGDVMYDAVLLFGAVAERSSRILERLSLDGCTYVVATIHRAETTDDPERLEAVLRSLARVAERLPVVFPVHPRTRQAARALGLDLGTMRVTDPLGYLDMMLLEKHASVIVTDSGGVQKEAYFHGVPCVTVRDETEWVELVEAGWNTLVQPEELPELVLRIASCRPSRQTPRDLYGDGHAAQRIARELLSAGTA